MTVDHLNIIFCQNDTWISLVAKMTPGIPWQRSLIGLIWKSCCLIILILQNKIFMLKPFEYHFLPTTYRGDLLHFSTYRRGTQMALTSKFYYVILVWLNHKIFIWDLSENVVKVFQVSFFAKNDIQVSSWFLCYSRHLYLY